MAPPFPNSPALFPVAPPPLRAPPFPNDSTPLLRTPPFPNGPTIGSWVLCPSLRTPLFSSTPHPSLRTPPFPNGPAPPSGPHPLPVAPPFPTDSTPHSGPRPFPTAPPLPHPPHPALPPPSLWPQARYWGAGANEVQGVVLSRSGTVVERLAGKWHEGLHRGPAPGQCVWRASKDRGGGRAGGGGVIPHPGGLSIVPPLPPAQTPCPATTRETTASPSLPWS